ncbi:MHS family MFS transporter [Rhodococcoides fascians A21d2]|uniref:MFS transporter n=1 Tax=Rhodococcoides fascians TaxID=1828 RepID=UPI000691ECCA|nr:MFS transporter [Rhodococcus fascians]QII00276.1 MHS family MFS transporter [Rhodococcus fascians A21d2]
MAEQQEGVDPTDAPLVASPKEYRRILTSSFIGSTVEFYDFLLYGTAAALVFGPLFFSDLSPSMALLASFATFTVGYIARPIGGVLFGHLGDRIGRKSSLVITMAMMGIASTAIGLVPTHEQIGSWAAVLLLILRIIQGLAVGGEWGGAALMALEHAPQKQRGLAASVANMGGPAGAMLATLVFAGFALLPDDQFLSWGWRIPFLLSAVLVLVALFIRLRISESPLFLAAQAKAQQTKRKVQAPVMVILTRYRAQVAIAALGGVAAFVYSSFMATFAISIAREMGTGSTAVLLCKAGAAFVHIFTIAYFARLSDRIGRRKVMLGGCGLSIMLAFPVIWLLSSGNTAFVLLAFLIGNPLIQGSLYGPLAAYIAERFSTSSRYTGAGLTYQISTVLASFTPIISSAVWVIGEELFGSAGATQYSLVGLYLIVATLISLTAIALSRDTLDRDLDESGSPDLVTNPATQAR